MLTENLAITRRSGFKSIGINAFVFEETVRAVLISHRTDNPSEGVAESPPNHTALIRGKLDIISGLYENRQAKTAKSIHYFSPDISRWTKKVCKNEPPPGLMKMSQTELPTVIPFLFRLFFLT